MAGISCSNIKVGDKVTFSEGGVYKSRKVVQVGSDYVVVDVNRKPVKLVQHRITSHVANMVSEKNPYKGKKNIWD